MLTQTATLMGHSRVARRNRNLSTYTTTTSMGPITTTLFLAVIVGLLALVYLTQITKTSVYGYQVSNLTDQREELLERQQELEVEAARLQAVARVQSSEVAKGLTAESQVSFATPNLQ